MNYLYKPGVRPLKSVVTPSSEPILKIVLTMPEYRGISPAAVYYNYNLTLAQSIGIVTDYMHFK